MSAAELTELGGIPHYLSLSLTGGGLSPVVARHLFPSVIHCARAIDLFGDWSRAGGEL